jgi:hypothetical protein
MGERAIGGNIFHKLNKDTQFNAFGASAQLLYYCGTY